MPLIILKELRVRVKFKRPNRRGVTDSAPSPARDRHNRMHSRLVVATATQCNDSEQSGWCSRVELSHCAYPNTPAYEIAYTWRTIVGRCDQLCDVIPRALLLFFAMAEILHQNQGVIIMNRQTEQTPDGCVVNSVDSVLAHN